MKHELIKLPYNYSDLEPFIDAQTMEVHHTKHHQGYVNKLNKTLENYPNLQNLSIENLLKDTNQIPEEIRQKVINFGGGVYNHNFFWEIMSPKPIEKPEGKLLEAINETFESFDIFKDDFISLATTLFGSGWTWLVKNQNNELIILQTKNQDSPISQGLTPILGVDVWEHAYYLKYQNKRAEYLENWWKVINWKKAEELFTENN